MGAVSRPHSLVLAVLTVLSVVSASSAAAATTPADLQRGLRQLVNAPGGPPGAIATIYRDGHLTVLRAGRADLAHARAPLATDHMRIASISKAFTGAVALNLVRAGKLGLDDTIGQRLPEMPSAWPASPCDSCSITPAAFPTTPQPSGSSNS